MRFYPDVKLEFDSPVPLHHQLAKSVRESIERHRLPAETPLPSMLTLARDLKLNRETVRRAYGTLIADGVIGREPNKRILYVTPEFADSYCNRLLPALGIVLPDTMGEVLKNRSSSAMEIVGGAMDMATQFGFAAMIVPLPSDGEDFTMWERWRKEMLGKLNGLIYLGECQLRNHAKAFESLLGDESLPQVFVGGHPFRPHLGAVTLDMGIGFSAAVEHLSELGHSRVAAIGKWIPHREIFQLQTNERSSTMVNAMRGHFPLRDEWICVEQQLDEALRSRVRAMLTAPERPSAILFDCDDIASYCLPVIRECGLRIPEDLSFISFDDSPLAETGEPPWTAIRHPKRLSGQEAVRMIAEARQTNVPIHTICRKLSCPLVIRQTTGPCRMT